MIARPITIVEPQIWRLIDGELRQLWRPPGMLDRIAPGDVLWVREPFHLEPRFSVHAPTTALEWGARVHFAAEFKGEVPAGLGRRRFARELPRAAHRQHLLVTAVDRRPLHSITGMERWQQGYASDESFATEWDGNLALAKKRDRLWRLNPATLVIAFERRAVPYVPATETELAA